MEKEVAKEIFVKAFRCSSDLSQILALTNGRVSDNEYSELRRSVADVAAVIGQSILSPLLQRFPEIEEEIDSEIEKSGTV